NSSPSISGKMSASGWNLISPPRTCVVVWVVVSSVSIIHLLGPRLCRRAFSLGSRDSPTPQWWIRFPASRRQDVLVDDARLEILPPAPGEGRAVESIDRARVHAAILGDLGFRMENLPAERENVGIVLHCAVLRCMGTARMRTRAVLDSTALKLRLEIEIRGR